MDFKYTKIALAGKKFMQQNVEVCHRHQALKYIWNKLVAAVSINSRASSITPLQISYNYA